MRVLQVGAATTPICGVRDYSGVLDRLLAENASSCGRVWWERKAGESLRSGLRGAREWCARVADAARTTAPDWLLWHYTPHLYGYRGVPYLVRSVSAGLGRTGIPMVVLLHEIGAGWGSRGWRGFGQAVLHRLALVQVLRSCRGAVVTIEDRLRLIERSRWLPHPALHLAPVFSTIPVVDSGRDGRPDRNEIPVTGIFGYGGFGPEEVLTDVIVGALAGLRRQGADTRLLLIGHPGPASPAADRWRRAGARVGIDRMEFTGVLEPAALPLALRRVDLMILPDRSGPTPRKATLAASLAHGLPIVGFEAPTAWKQLVDEHAVCLAPQTEEGLAQVLLELLRDEERRTGLGLRAGEFYRRNMRPELMVRRLLAFLESLATQRGSSRSVPEASGAAASGSRV